MFSRLDGTPVFSSNAVVNYTGNSYYATMQIDGNLVIYSQIARPAPAAIQSIRCGEKYGACQSALSPFCSSAGHCGATYSYVNGGQYLYNYFASNSTCHLPEPTGSGQCGPGKGSCPTASSPYCSQNGKFGYTFAHAQSGQIAYNYCMAPVWTTGSGGRSTSGKYW